MEREEKEFKRVWEVYPGYSYAVQLYHSYDFEMIRGTEDFTDKQLKSLYEAIRRTHLCIMAIMDEDDLQDLLRSVHDMTERKRILRDWQFVCSIFRDDFYELLAEHRADKGN